MSDGHNGTWADTTLRRPAVDPAIPAAARRLLTAPGAILTPSSQGRPRLRRDYLPAQPDKREATVYGAVTGMTAAAFVAITGATPWAVGILIFQGPAGWQSASGQVALVLAEIIAVLTAVVFGLRVVRFGQLNGQVPAAAAARAYHGRYLTGADFDAPARMRSTPRLRPGSAGQACSTGPATAPRSPGRSGISRLPCASRPGCAVCGRRFPSSAPARQPRGCCSARTRRRRWRSGASPSGFRR
jgi:hypothetical protein